MQRTDHILIAGASGVIGAGAIEHFARTPGWQVTALSRRAPVVAADCTFAHLSADLTDGEACRSAVARLPPVTHLIYAAVAEAPGLVSGWRDPELMALNGVMFANLLDPLAASGALRHVSMVQGAKAYGAQYHDVEVPCREDTPRDPHPNFYWLHEDHLRHCARQADFRFTIFRPQVLLGAAPGAAMNPVAPIGVYAALCRELGRPFAYPGHADALWEVVDTGLMAEAFHWAATLPAAAGETYNVTNGDVFVPAHAWPHIAARFGLETEGESPASLAAFFAEPDVAAAWARLAGRHGLRLAALPDLLGQSHHYVDLLIGERLAAKRLPLLLSTIKIRQAGFAACRDSLGSMFHWLDRMTALRLLPPLRDQAAAA